MGHDGLMNFRKRKSTTTTTITCVLLIQPCWYIARPCESDFGLWMIRQGWTNEHLSVLLHPSTETEREREREGRKRGGERERERERERVYTDAKFQKMFLHAVTRRKSSHVSSLAPDKQTCEVRRIRIDHWDFGLSWKKWFARITRILFFSRSRNFDLSFNVFRSENVKVQLESFPNCFDQCMIYSSFQNNR